MASGCILGECWVCGELVWEDEAEWDIENNVLVHLKCSGKVGTYKQEVKLLRKQLYEARERIKELESEGIE